MRFSRVVMVVSVLAALILAGPSCIKSKYVFTVYPDGSGKVETQTRSEVDLYGTLLDLIKLLDEDDPEVDTTKLIEKTLFDQRAEETEGLVAWTKVKHERLDDGAGVISFSGYFQDINQVRFKRGDEITGTERFSFKKLADGSYRFVASMDLEGEGIPMPESAETEEKKKEALKQMQGVMGTLLKGVEFSYEVRLPGEATPKEGLETEGREARGKVDLSALMDKMLETMTRKKETNGTIVMMEATGSAEGDLTEEMAAFREEMSRVKAEWEKRKAELDKAENPFEDEEEEDKKEDPEEGKGKGKELAPAGPASARRL